MDCHLFNIGKPATTEWWLQTLQRQVITAGFSNSPDDRGSAILRNMREGDRILAFCSGHGFVGAGIVGPISTYKLHRALPRDSLSNHHHERHVDWQHAVRDVTLAVKARAAGISHGSATKQRLHSKEAADRVVALLVQRSALAGLEEPSSEHKYWHVLEAVRDMGRSCSVKEITAWLTRHHPGDNSDDARDNVTLLTVNDANRRHHDSRKDFRTDRGNPKDALYREGRYKGVTYELYRPANHGIWDIQLDALGKLSALKLASSPIEIALAEARKAEESQMQGALGSIEDERTRALRAVVLREGQGEFRRNLLDAYNRCCAVTGCQVEEILEAAHIHPYLGAATNRVDNGLLLRADIHTLFDKGMMWVDEGYVVRVSKRLHESDYKKLDGNRLGLPKDEAQHPHPLHLAHHRRSTREPAGDCSD